MEFTAVPPSGTFLWSPSLLASREGEITHLGLGRGGGVEDGWPSRRGTLGAQLRVLA